jgi:hypothetical protein
MVNQDGRCGPLTREAMYELRRVYIQRLQVATRGVPRSERIEGLLAFIQGWNELSDGGRLNDLARLLADQSVETPVPEMFAKLVQGKAASLVSIESGPRILPRGQRTGIDVENADGSDGPRTWRAGRHQGDLFPIGLAAQPL